MPLPFGAAGPGGPPLPFGGGVATSLPLPFGRAGAGASLPLPLGASLLPFPAAGAGGDGGGPPSPFLSVLLWLLLATSLSLSTASTFGSASVAVSALVARLFTGPVDIAFAADSFGTASVVASALVAGPCTGPSDIALLAADSCCSKAEGAVIGDNGGAAKLRSKLDAALMGAITACAIREDHMSLRSCCIESTMFPLTELGIVLLNVEIDERKLSCAYLVSATKSNGAEEEAPCI